jgi:thymidylate synthase
LDPSSALSLTEAWQQLLKDLLLNGRETSPRGMKTLELPQHTVSFDMRWPVITVPQRKLHVPFLGGEAYWILSGDDTVEGIKDYNRHIGQFSDDGVKFFGAYGPKVCGQMLYVVDKLREDPQSRQAGMTIWRENPPTTKDVPCTIALFFNVRGGKLHAHVFMRSSDAWLGLPYDAFNFTMVAATIVKELNKDRLPGLHMELGTQYLTMVSSHLYEQHWDIAKQCLQPVELGWSIPKEFTDPNIEILEVLDDLRRSKRGDAIRWFEAHRAEDFLYGDDNATD